MTLMIIVTYMNRNMRKFIYRDELDFKHSNADN